MTVLTSLPNGVSNRDFRDTVNAALVDIALLKSNVGTPPPAPTLGALALAAATITENAAAGTVVGGITGATSGSTLSLANDDGGRFAISGPNLIAGLTNIDFEAGASRSIVIRETLSGATNSPRDTTLAVGVVNVNEQPSLRALLLSSTSLTIGTAASGTISQAAAGSAITASGLPAGFSINGPARTWAYDGSGPASNSTVTLTETLGDSPNSPRQTQIGLSVAAVAGDEPVISPPVTTARSTYALTDRGIIQRKPSNMPGFGPYWPTPAINPNAAWSVATDPFWGALGFKWLVYYTTDHNGEGGVWLSLSRLDDPFDLTGWMTYTAALAAGHFASVATKPSGEPIYKHGAGLSTETARVKKIGDTWVMTYQTYQLPNSTGQCTNRVLSTDGLNWTGEVKAPLLVITGQALGNTGIEPHTGYFDWWINPFDRAIHPYDYFGYSLAHGGARGLFAMWGTNDPVNGEWTFIQTMSPQRGRLGAQFTGAGSDMSSARVTRQGVALIGGRSAGGSGTENQYGTLSEAIFDPTGTEVLFAPNDLFAMPLNADVSSDASVPVAVTRGNDRVVFYQGSRAPDANTHVNTVAIASTPRRNPQNTWAAPLSPAIPTSMTVRDTDFRTISALPSYLSMFNNMTTGSVAYDSITGLKIEQPSSGSTRNIVVYGEEIPGTAEFIDFYIRDFRSRGTGAWRTMGFGFAIMAAGAALPGLASAADGIYCRTGGSGNVGVKARKVNNAESTNALTSYPSFGYQSSSVPYGRKNLGLRWFLKERRFYLLGEGYLSYGIETEDLIIPDEFTDAFMSGKIIRPYFGVVTQPNINQVMQEQIAGFRYRWK